MGRGAPSGAPRVRRPVTHPPNFVSPCSGSETAPSLPPGPPVPASPVPPAPSPAAAPALIPAPVKAATQSPAAVTAPKSAAAPAPAVVAPGAAYAPLFCSEGDQVRTRPARRSPRAPPAMLPLSWMGCCWLFGIIRALFSPHLPHPKLSCFPEPCAPLPLCTSLFPQTHLRIGVHSRSPTPLVGDGVGQRMGGELRGMGGGEEIRARGVRRRPPPCSPRVAPPPSPFDPPRGVCPCVVAVAPTLPDPEFEGLLSDAPHGGGIPRYIHDLHATYPWW